MDIVWEMLKNFNDDSNLFRKIITGEESWLCGYDIESKAQSSKWKRSEEPKPKKAHQVWSNVKVLLTVFFDCNGVVIMNSCHKVVRSIMNTALKI